MSNLMIAGIAVNTLLLVATVWFALTHQVKDKGLLVLKETWTTILMGGILVVLGVAICVMKLIDPALSGSEESTYYYIAGSSLLCQLLGGYTVLFGAVKRVVAYENQLAVVSAFGAVKEIPWESLTRVEKSTVGKTYKLMTVGGESFSVGGENVDEFLALMRKKMSPTKGATLLHQVEARLR